MSKYHKIALLLFLFCNSPVQAQGIDPCNTIEGHWKGEWKNNVCTWKMEETNITRIKESIMLSTRIVPVSQPYPYACNEVTVFLYGVCKDGHITVDSENSKPIQLIEGTIKEKEIKLSNSDNEIKLQKQSR